MSKSRSFRVGKVQAYLRGKVWYLCYHDNGKRRRPRVGSDKEGARQLAAQTNAQLVTGVPAMLSFEPISIPDLREQWLQHHELVLRSSVRTVARYRTATQHLLRYLEANPLGRYASHFRVNHAEAFVRHLRCIKVASNGHPNTAKRLLMDKGITFVMETCRAMFNYAAKRRHLPPYAENPFSAMEIERIPIQETRPIILFSEEQERRFLEACDHWQFPLFLTLMLTGLRPGELTHLLLPEDLDLDAGILRVRNKPKLGWQVKTRNERDIPLVSVLVAVLRHHLAGRSQGPVFRRRRFCGTAGEKMACGVEGLEHELENRVQAKEQALGASLAPAERSRLARRLWVQLGAVKEDRVRTEFMKLTARIGSPQCTAPKMLRHLFATVLQEGRVDPLIRNELMGHVASGDRSPGHGLNMTAVYTHTRPETCRQQLTEAIASRPSFTVASTWLRAAAVPVLGQTLIEMVEPLEGL
jgi:integrase